MECTECTECAECTCTDFVFYCLCDSFSQELGGSEFKEASFFSKLLAINEESLVDAISLNRICYTFDNIELFKTVTYQFSLNVQQVLLFLFDFCFLLSEK